MLRTQAMMLAAAAAAATLVVAGCDRQDAGQAQTVGAKGSTEIAKPVDRSVADKSSDNGNTILVASARDDAAITTKVTQSILADPSLKPMQIKVDTKDGTVTLSGTVDTADMRTQAHTIAATTPGVAGVIDNLAVKNAG